MNTQQAIRVMLVDDHNVVRSGLATFLRAYENLELVGEEKLSP
jgi:DNA-binding NarL/FixJ family response regulator